MTRHYTREGDPSRVASRGLSNLTSERARPESPFVKDARTIRRAVRSNKENRRGRVINADEWPPRRTECPSDRKIPPRTWNSGFPVFARPRIKRNINSERKARLLRCADANRVSLAYRTRDSRETEGDGSSYAVSGLPRRDRVQCLTDRRLAGRLSIFLSRRRRWLSGCSGSSVLLATKRRGRVTSWWFEETAAVKTGNEQPLKRSHPELRAVSESHLAKVEDNARERDYYSRNTRCSSIGIWASVKLKSCLNRYFRGSVYFSLKGCGNVRFGFRIQRPRRGRGVDVEMDL